MMFSLHAFLFFVFCLEYSQTMPIYHSCISEEGCIGLRNGQYPSCINCTVYVTCNNGNDDVTDCPSGTVYDSATGRCDLNGSCSVVGVAVAQKGSPTRRKRQAVDLVDHEGNGTQTENNGVHPLHDEFKHEEDLIPPKPGDESVYLVVEEFDYGTRHEDYNFPVQESAIENPNADESSNNGTLDSAESGNSGSNGGSDDPINSGNHTVGGSDGGTEIGLVDVTDEGDGDGDNNTNEGSNGGQKGGSDGMINEGSNAKGDGSSEPGGQADNGNDPRESSNNGTERAPSANSEEGFENGIYDDSDEGRIIGIYETQDGQHFHVKLHPAMGIFSGFVKGKNGSHYIGTNDQVVSTENDGSSARTAVDTRDKGDGYAKNVEGSITEKENGGGSAYENGKGSDVEGGEEPGNGNGEESEGGGGNGSGNGNGEASDRENGEGAGNGNGEGPDGGNGDGAGNGNGEGENGDGNGNGEGSVEGGGNRAGDGNGEGSDGGNGEGEDGAGNENDEGSVGGGGNGAGDGNGEGSDGGNGEGEDGAGNGNDEGSVGGGGNGVGDGNGEGSDAGNGEGSGNESEDASGNTNMDGAVNSTGDGVADGTVEEIYSGIVEKPHDARRKGIQTLLTIINKLVKELQYGKVHNTKGNPKGNFSPQGKGVTKDNVHFFTRCLHSCNGKEDGEYHSCHGCNFFIECRNEKLRQHECGYGYNWDDRRKTCSRNSLTC